MNTENMIEVTGVDLRALVREVYALSKPQGMGFLNFQEGPLPEDDIDRILASGREHVFPVNMDYVHGRACKFSVRRDGEDRLWINSRWYDHGHWDLEELLKRVGFEKAVDQVQKPVSPERDVA